MDKILGKIPYDNAAKQNVSVYELVFGECDGKKYLDVKIRNDAPVPTAAFRFTVYPQSPRGERLAPVVITKKTRLDLGDAVSERVYLPAETLMGTVVRNTAIFDDGTHSEAPSSVGFATYEYIGIEVTFYQQNGSAASPARAYSPAPTERIAPAEKTSGETQRDGDAGKRSPLMTALFVIGLVLALPSLILLSSTVSCESKKDAADYGAIVRENSVSVVETTAAEENTTETAPSTLDDSKTARAYYLGGMSDDGYSELDVFFDACDGEDVWFDAYITVTDEYGSYVVFKVWFENEYVGEDYDPDCYEIRVYVDGQEQSVSYNYNSMVYYLDLEKDGVYYIEVCLRLLDGFDENLNKAFAIALY